MLNRYNFASSSFEFSTFLSSRNAKKIAWSPHFHLLYLSGVILQDYNPKLHARLTNDVTMVLTSASTISNMTIYTPLALNPQCF